MGLRAPSGSPVPDSSTMDDVDRALNIAHLYLKEGGEWAYVEGFVNEWLDYRSVLVLEQELVPTGGK